MLAAGCGCSGLFSGLLRVSAQLPGHVEHCFPALPGAGSRFVGTSDTNLLLFVNIKTFQLDEYKINVDKTHTQDLKSLFSMHIDILHYI